MTLYLDVIWLLNLFVDFILLWLTGLILKRQYALWRIAVGSLIGSVIIVISFSPFAHVVGNPLVKLLFSLIMVYSAFGFKRFRYYAANLLMFYFVTFLTGGILIGAHYFLTFDPGAETTVLLASIKGYGDPISWVFVMLALPIAWYFSKARMDSVEHVKIQYDQLVDVLVKIGEFEFTVRGLVDSGNQLQDPISKTPVMIVSIEGFKETVPEAVHVLCEEAEDIFSGKRNLEEQWTDRLRIVPAQSVGRNSQLLAAIKPDSIMLKDHESNWPSSGLIVFRQEPLSADDSFCAIVHPKMTAGKPVQNVS
ncbi:sigma-E processing peptidase SpoIIGA [Rossellomorea aquimaris]|uniref:sigma-E processing peptidase SpoIIGA n=1 Tax=Rossellomorea aquimaris TaxID=189382 RepID=UPI001CD4D3CF|nr:sigma-E processing peptidase SpoIIGA [Rossellomorea aquimaris]MCA1053429.1 sigma-E processing peptidase SpoIIGA [Rossellomorea aquimaris]